MDWPASEAEPVDYCQCGRGPVIGVVSYTDTRLQFFSLTDSYCRHLGEAAADLRCVDCLADASMDVANGVIRERMRQQAQERAAQIEAIQRQNEMRRAAGLPEVRSYTPGDCDEWPTGGER